jgi:hypothetical protein
MCPKHERGCDRSSAERRVQIASRIYGETTGVVPDHRLLERVGIGVHAPRLLAALSSDLAEWRSAGGFTAIARDGTL